MGENNYEVGRGMVVKEGDSAGNGGDRGEWKAEIGVRRVGLGGEWYRSGSRKSSQESSHLGWVLGQIPEAHNASQSQGSSVSTPNSHFHASF